MAMSNKELTYRAFINREYNFRHSPFEKEFEFYECVKSGNADSVLKLMTPLAGNGSGQLSENSLRNLKYHFIVTVALITRFCVEGGMEMETAYNLSDLYILKMDKCTDEKQIHELHKEAVLDFTEYMNRIAHEEIYSKPVIKAMDYIYDNLHSSLSLEDIADHTGLSHSYMSRLFHKEVGVTLSDYIAIKRVETAGNMLRFSDYSIVDIGNYLAFSSNSHFISTFKKIVGMTPGEYRKKYYRSNWGDKKT